MAQQKTGAAKAPRIYRQTNKQTKQKKRGRLLAIILVLLMLVTIVPFPVYGYVQTMMYPLKYTEQVEKWASAYVLDPYFVYAVIRTESSFQPEAESAVGARGLMQMTEETFDWLKPQVAPGDDSITFNDLYDPETSVRFGTYFLALCIQRYGGDLSTAAAAYHSGLGTVDRLLQEGEHTQNGVHLTSFPYEQMNHYVDKVNKSYEKYRSLYAQ